jgi:transposase
LWSVCLQILGIDEHTLHKKERYVTTLCDLRRHRIFDVVDGKSEDDLKDFPSLLKGRDKVRIVCMDLSSSYKSLVRKYFPQAMIVADRFHVIRVAMHHLLAIARELIPDMARINTRRVMRLLATRPDRLEDRLKNELDRLFGKAPALQAVYDKLQQVCSILRAKGQNKPQCKRLIERLMHAIEELRQSGLKPAQTLARTLSDWSEEIARMWRFSRSNGITEGFHRKMKLIQRRAYGFRNFQNYRLRVIAQCG